MSNTKTATPSGAGTTTGSRVKKHKAGAKKGEQKAGAAPVRPGAGKLVTLVVALLALSALLTSGYLWYVLKYRERLLGTDLHTQVAAQGGQIAELRAAADKVRTDLGEARVTLKDVQQKQQVFGRSLQTLIEERGRGRDDLALEEVKQILLLANQHLKIAGDIDTAIAALRVADSRLKRLPDPTLLDVRKLIAGELARLQTVERVDTPGVALRLAALADAVDKLPLATRARFVQEETTPPAADAEGGAWRRVLGEVWSDLRGLVEVRRIEATRPPLLPPEQNYFLRENLRLLLYGAQIALLREQVEVYRTQLARAKTWLRDYFDTEAGTVRNVLTELEAMEKLEINPELPDISASLQALTDRKKPPAAP